MKTEISRLLHLKIGARNSLLSIAQFEEVLREIKMFYSEIIFEPVFIVTYGDRDQHISLRSMGKTDFFTREIDEMILTNQCRIGIHSAKDLPDPLREGLSIVALTKGVDSSDSLLLREGTTLQTLKAGSTIATSSLRRENMVKALRPDLTFTDIRGTVEQRIAKLDRGEFEGLVIAEAALIRLGLTHLNRFKLLGETAPFQGQLAVVARQDDFDMHQLFHAIDTRTFL